jgi:TniQ
MSEQGLSGQLFPRHVQPQRDELLSSWLTRLSLAHGLDPRTFGSILWPAKTIWTGDIDRRATPEMLSILAQKTATSPRQALATTLRAYEGKLWEDGDSSRSRHWLLLGAIQGRRRDRPGLQYCPQCLRADPTPYFRRCWRLGFVTVCTDHHCYLLDRCPACFDPVNFHLLPYDTDTMTRCYQCQLDFVGVASRALEPSEGHQRLVAFQTLLLQALANGWYPLAENQMVRLPDYLRVVRHLGRLLLTHRDADLQRARLCRRLEQPYFVPCWPASKAWALEGLSVTDRFRLLLLLAWWLEDWPEQFIAVCLDHMIWPRDLLGHMPSPPQWYEHTVQKVSWGEALKRAIQAYIDAQNAP